MRGRFFATGVGSVPFDDPGEAVEFVLRNFPDIPFWPQLPKRSFYENMYTQYIGGFPSVNIDEGKRVLWIDTEKNFTAELEKAYLKIVENDLDYFAFKKEEAEGFFEFLEGLKKNLKRECAIVKGHVTGPVSLGLSVTDQDKKSILYHTELSELLTKILAVKTRWQIGKLKHLTDNIIIFIDEPYLVSIGSSHVNIKKDSAAEMLKDLVETIHKEDALAGMHCCGNTDWPFLMNLGIDILNLDAYNFMKSLSLYPKELSAFLKSGGFVAWGMVPTSDAIDAEDAESLAERFEDGIDLLAVKGVPREALLDSAIITPSCGCGTLSVEKAKKVLEVTALLGGGLRKKYQRSAA